MSYRLTLDGQNFDPQEWKDTEFVTGWEDDVYSTKGNASLTFTGDAYAYLVGRYDASYCNTVECKIYICDELRHTGLIFLSEAQIDRIKCTISVSVSDVDWNALVKNKRKQVYYLDQDKSSNGTTITPAAASQIEFHYVTNYSTGSGGDPVGANSTCYRVFEALQFLVAAMSDNQIEFVSDFFGSGGEGYNWMLVTGREIRLPGDADNLAPGISFEDLYADLKALFNLRLWTEDNSGTQRVRIEPFDYFRSLSVSTAISGVTQLTERVMAEEVYSTVKLGSRASRLASETPTTSFEPISYLGWSDETFNVRGDCVTDTSLDISVRNLIIDSNSIQAQIAGEENKDDDVFLVATDGTSTLAYDFLGTGDYFYNFPFTNSTVSNRWSNRIHNAGFSDRGDANGSFEASPASNQSGFINGMASVIAFDNEISDPDTAYDPATLAGVYTAPADGLYLFTVQGEFEVTYNAFEEPFIEWVIEISVNLAEYETRRIRLNTVPGATIRYSITQVFGVNVLSGDDVVTSQDFQNSNFPTTPDTTTAITYLTDSRFKIEGLFVGDSVPLEYTTEYPLTPEQYDTILANREKKLDIDGYRGWVRNITFRPFGLSQITLEAVKEA